MAWNMAWRSAIAICLNKDGVYVGCSLFKVLSLSMLFQMPWGHWMLVIV
jgi:hypothetical protein